MFALLRLATSAARVEWKAPPQTDAAFDIVYYSGSDTPYPLSMNGHYAGFRLYNGDTPNATKLITSQDDLRIGDITVQQYHETITLKKKNGNDQPYVQIRFDVINDGETAKRFDLGVFSDSAMGSSADDAKLTIRSDKRGVIISMPKTPSQKATYLLRGQYFPNVDAIYIGEDSSTDLLDHTRYPFFLNNETALPANADSVLAFSWQNRTIYPGERISLGFLVTQGDYIDLPPFITDYTSPTTVPANQDVNITIEAANYEAQNLTMKFFINGSTDSIDYTAATNEADNFAVNFTHTVNLKGGLSLSYHAYAVDDNGIKSNEIDGNFLAEGGLPPFLDIILPTRSNKYQPNEQIKLTGTVRDEVEAHVYIKWDDREPTAAYQDYYNLGNKNKDISYSIPIPSYLSIGTEHILSIWATDNLGIRDAGITYPFTIEAPPGPKVYSAYGSDTRIQAGKNFIVYGEANSNTTGEQLTISLQFGDVETKTLGKITSQATLDPFAFLYVIPSVDPGKYVLSLTATDSYNQTSTDLVNFTVQVVGADLPVVQLANFTDMSEADLGDWTNATVDVYYQTPEKTGQSMTHEDYGIFSAFRVRQQGSTDEVATNVLSYYNDKNNKTVDGVNVQAYTRYEEHTGYFQIVWKVTNDNYLPRSVDLGVFYDSDFSYNDNATIEIRNDGRGISVIDNDKVEEAIMKYTIFLKRYGDYPSVDSWYLFPVAKDEDGHVRTQDMPFFRNSDDVATSGDGMIAFSWNDRLIGSHQTVEFVATFVGDYDLQIPTTIFDSTDYYSYIYPGDYIQLQVEIVDADIGQQIQLLVTINGTHDGSQDEIITIPEGGFYTWTRYYQVGTVGHNFQYAIQARDTAGFYMSNIINVSIPTSAPPLVYVDFSYLNDIYFFNDTIRLKGEIWDEEGATLMYSIGGGQPQAAGPYLSVSSASSVEFDYNITIPSDLLPGTSYLLKFWAVDQYGNFNSPDYQSDNTHMFYYDQRDPSEILKAGFNLKRAKIGSKVIAFIMLQHDVIGTELLPQVRFGNNEWITSPKSEYAADPPVPVAWYVTIPSNLQPGTYIVEFRAIDTFNTPSKNSIKFSMQIE